LAAGAAEYEALRQLFLERWERDAVVEIGDRIIGPENVMVMINECGIVFHTLWSPHPLTDLLRHSSTMIINYAVTTVLCDTV